MWLVSGVDEEHRFREWGEAVEYYRQMVRGWVGDHGDTAGAAPALDGLPVGGAHHAVFPDPDGAGQKVEFRIGWEVPRVGLDHFTAC
jgi:hypothetical protein